MNLRRGMMRLALGLAAVWFVYWTLVYVARPRVAENTPEPPPLSLTTDLLLAALGLAAAYVGLRWIIAGFHRD